jgi:hypothetical protein
MVNCKLQLLSEMRLYYNRIKYNIRMAQKVCLCINCYDGCLFNTLDYCILQEIEKNINILESSLSRHSDIPLQVPIDIIEIDDIIDITEIYDGDTEFSNSIWS